ncbi:unnamed protein product [Phytomonas sp. EM1]|nr:unnamed protein product [Phytomonas sp. EM1]|eukprot:CCW63127.1 unnamed protein product [Phytomonas sp. isolate EM1]
MLDDRELITWRHFLWSCFYTHSSLQEEQGQTTTRHVARVMRKDDFYASMRDFVRDVRRRFPSYFPKESKSDVEWILHQFSIGDVLRQVWTTLVSRQEALLEDEPGGEDPESKKLCIGQQMRNQELPQYSNGNKQKPMKNLTPSVGWDVFSVVLLAHIKKILSLSQVNPVKGTNCASNNSKSTSRVRCDIDPPKGVRNSNSSPANLSRVTVSMSPVTDPDVSEGDEQSSPEVTYGLDQELNLMLRTEEIDLARECLSDTLEEQHPHVKSKPTRDTPRSLWSSVLNVKLPPVSKLTALPPSESSHCRTKHLTVDPLRDVKGCVGHENKPERFKREANKPPLSGAWLNKNKTNTLVMDNNANSDSLNTLVPVVNGSIMVPNMVDDKPETRPSPSFVRNEGFTRQEKQKTYAQVLDGSRGMLVGAKTYSVMSEVMNPNDYCEGRSFSQLQRTPVSFNPQRMPSGPQKLERGWSYPSIETYQRKNPPTKVVEDPSALPDRTKSKLRRSVCITDPSEVVPTSSSSGGSIRAHDRELTESRSSAMSHSPGARISPSSFVLIPSRRVAGRGIQESSIPIHDPTTPPLVGGSDQPPKVVVPTATACPVNPPPTGDRIEGSVNHNGPDMGGSHAPEKSPQRFPNGSIHRTFKEELTPVASWSQSPPPTVTADHAYQRCASQPYRSSCSFTPVGRTLGKCKWADSPQIDPCNSNGVLYSSVNIPPWQDPACAKSQENAYHGVNLNKNDPDNEFARAIISSRDVEQGIKLNSVPEACVSKSFPESGASREGKWKPPTHLSNRARQRVDFHRSNSFSYPQWARLNPPSVPRTRCRIRDP